MLERIWSAISSALGLGVEGKDLSACHMSWRAVAVFVVSITLIRLGNKRFMGKSTALDVLLGIVFGSVVSRAITGNAPFLPTRAAALVLVLLHWALAAVAFRSEAFGALVKGRDVVLVRDGRIRPGAMRRAHITEEDLREALRGEGEQPDIDKIEAAHLERNGEISIILRGRK
jgi:uncharacterized membrane protein YcaP (DUF421 family)